MDHFADQHKSADDDFEAMAASYRAGLEEWMRDGPSHLRAKLVNLLSKCESPIERRMGAALFGFMHGLFDDHECVKLSPQYQIGQYRVDFLLELVGKADSVSVVVECDGHAFHERTKFQAERDKRRDREITHAGYTVLRFTGSEIWRDPVECAVSVIDTALALAEDRHAAAGGKS